MLIFALLSVSLLAFAETRDETFTVNGVSFRMVAVEGGTFMMGAMIEYGLEHKVKDLGEEGFAYAFKRALVYLDKSRAMVEIPERAEECLKMSPTQLDQRIHKEYTVPVETREVLKP